jgi:hypothetical protein
MLERWFLKTTINLWAGTRSPRRWLMSSSPDEPHDALIRATFGSSELPSSMALCATSIIGQEIDSDDTMAFAPLVEKNTYIVGGLFRFRGHRFVLWLHDQPPPPTLEALNLQHPEWCGATLHRRLEQIKYQLGDHISRRLVFRW